MPVLVAWAVVAALDYTTAAVVIASIAYAVTSVAITMAINYALGRVASAIAGNPSHNTQPVPQTFMSRGTTYPRSIIYGQARTSGVAIYEYTRA